MTMNSSTLTTVICAVYSKDPIKKDLLHGHMENLSQQTRSHNRIYVFEDGDTPPNWLDGETIVVNRALTIYEAWNAALPFVRTPFVMNLNLDDRLHRNGIESLQAAAISTDAKVVGAEWEICFSQQETDQVSECHGIADMVWNDVWPPVNKGGRQILGSGYGMRGTMGPAALWRSDIHRKISRYPYELKDGTLIRSAADAIFVQTVHKVFGKESLFRLPLVIGRYHSHPSTQAEFRFPEDPRDIARCV